MTRFKSTFGKFVYNSKTDNYMLENTVRIHGQEQKEKEYVSLEDLGFKKEFKGFWIEIREATDSYSLLPLKAYFKQHFIVKIRRRKNLKHTYLKKERTSLYVRHFDKETYGKGGNPTHQVRREELLKNDELFSFQLIGKPKRVSQATLEALKKDEGYIGSFNQRGWLEV